MDTRMLMTGLSAGRIAVGLGFVLAPAVLARLWFGGAAATPATKVATRALGVRDVAIGAATLGTMRATGTTGTGFKVLTGLGVLCDAVDAAATLGERGALPGRGSLAVAMAGGAAATGLAVLARG